MFQVVKFNIGGDSVELPRGLRVFVYASSGAGIEYLRYEAGAIVMLSYFIKLCGKGKVPELQYLLYKYMSGIMEYDGKKVAVYLYVDKKFLQELASLSSTLDIQKVRTISGIHDTINGNPSDKDISVLDIFKYSIKLPFPYSGIQPSRWLRFPDGKKVLYHKNTVVVSYRWDDEIGDVVIGITKAGMYQTLPKLESWLKRYNYDIYDSEGELKSFFEENHIHQIVNHPGITPDFVMFRYDAGSSLIGASGLIGVHKEVSLTKLIEDPNKEDYAHVLERMLWDGKLTKYIRSNAKQTGKLISKFRSLWAPLLFTQVVKVE